METKTITITQEEYNELIRKSLKYDYLYELAQESGYLTDRERMIYGIKKED
jgi:hypothetical protein